MSQSPSMISFTTAQTPIPSASFNTNFSNLHTAINSIDEDQVNPSSTILLSTSSKTITGLFAFTTAPTLPALSIADASLSANVPLKDGTNTFTGVNTFNEPVEKFRLPQLAAHPTTAAYDNAIYEYTGDGKAYIYQDGSGEARVDYTGGYTGGAVRSYAGASITDENTPIIIPFKCDGSFTTATINLIGLGFPSWVYTELAAHTHDGSTLALNNGDVVNYSHTHDTNISHGHSGTFASSAHTHVGGNHNHSVNGLVTSMSSTHDHSGVTGDYGFTGLEAPNHYHTISPAGAHAHTISGNTSSEQAITGSPSATASVAAYSGAGTTSGTPTYSTAPSVDETIDGATASTGITGNTLNTTIKANVTSAIKIYITQDMASWGTGYDSVTYAALANILSTNGTGDINIFSKCASGYNYIKIVDETANTGGTIAWHIETS